MNYASLAPKSRPDEQKVLVVPAFGRYPSFSGLLKAFLIVCYGLAISVLVVSSKDRDEGLVRCGWHARRYRQERLLDPDHRALTVSEDLCQAT